MCINYSVQTWILWKGEIERTSDCILSQPILSEEIQSKMALGSNAMSWGITLYVAHCCHLVKKAFFKNRVEIYKPWSLSLRGSFLFAAQDHLHWENGGLTTYPSLGCRTSHQGHIRNTINKELDMKCNWHTKS